MDETDSIFFHEDDYCQIELLPIENILTKRNEIDLSKQHFEYRLNPDGFTQALIRNQISYPIEYLNIKMEEFEKALSDDILFKFKSVYMGYSTQKIIKKNTRGFGFENYILFYEFETEIITKAWIVYKSLSDTLNIYPANLKNALFKLGKKYNLILVDWNVFTTILLNDNIKLSNYVQEVL